MTVLLRPMRRRTRNTITVESIRDGPVTETVEILSEDPPDHIRRRLIEHHHPQLLCQVCAGPANSTEDGVLWLLNEGTRHPAACLAQPPTVLSTVGSTPSWPDYWRWGQA